MYERVGGEVYNTASVIDPAGSVVQRYRKIFPFCPYEQTLRLRLAAVCFRCAAGPLGLGDCYDMRSPELVRSLALAEADHQSDAHQHH